MAKDLKAEIKTILAQVDYSNTKEQSTEVRMCKTNVLLRSLPSRVLGTPEASGWEALGDKALYNRGPQPPGQELVLVHGLLGTRLHSRR